MPSLFESLEKNLTSQKSFKSNEESKRRLDARMGRSISDKSLLGKNNNKFLILINVLGSSGPIRFMVKGEDNVKSVIEKALKVYDREGRIPVLSTNCDDFFLYSADNGFEPLDLRDEIRSCGAQKFVLCMTEGRTQSVNYIKEKKWSAWPKKSLSLKILSL